MGTLDFFVIFIIVFLFFVFGLMAFFVTRGLNKINETLNKSVFNLQDSFTKHLSSSQMTISTVTENLTKLKSATENILEVGKNIQSLQDILKPPKLRGVLGELMLEQVLAQVLPSQTYKMFHKFQNGDIVDAVVKLKDSQILCIDAKFPLDSIKEHITNNVQNLESLPSQFVRDVKKHIDSISTKYILPNEGTLDFALMYIPAESIYYEIILRDDKITTYAKEKHVFPVSPLSLYSYLSTILIGLKGMDIEKNAKQILGQIGNIRIGVENFLGEFEKIGTHINNAKSKYDSSREIISGISDKLKNIETVKDDII